MTPHKLLSLLMFVGSVASTDWSSSTYRTDTGQLCNKCPPGHYVQEDCLGTNHTSYCRPCQPGTYQNEPTESPSCIRCTEYCPIDRAEIAQDCTLISDAVCQCKAGFYRKQEDNENYVCLTYEECPVGFGVVRPGNHDNNTTCKLCGAGYFSDTVSKTDPCKPCRNCSEGDQEKQPCTSKNDTICESHTESDQDDAMPVAVIVPVVIGVFIIIIIIVILIVCAQQGRGPECLTKIFHKCRESQTQEEMPMVPNGRIPMDENKAAADPLPQRKLIDLAEDLIASNWQFFFRQLFTIDIDTKLEQVKHNYPLNVKEQIYQMLVLWKQNTETSCVQETLCAVLRNHNPALIDKYFSEHEQNGHVTIEMRNNTSSSETQPLTVVGADQHAPESNGVTRNG